VRRPSPRCPAPVANRVNLNLTILKKGLLLIAVPLVFQLIFIAVLDRMLSESAEVERMALHTKDVIARGDAAFGRLVLAQSAARGLILTGNPLLDGEATAAGREAMAQIDLLEQLVADNPKQAPRIARLRELAANAIRLLSDEQKAVRAGHREEAVVRVATLDSRTRMDAVRAEMDDFLGEENGLDRQRLHRVADARTAERWAMGGGALGAALVSCLVAFMFARGISGRLRVATENAERLAENRSLAGRLRGADEIARLDAVMHETSRRLTGSAAAEQRLRDELQRRAAALVVANESLRQQTEENELFVYSVSHDLRSPMVNLQGFSKELTLAGEELRRLTADDRVPADVRRQIVQVLDEDVVTSVKFIQSAVTRSAAIIDALLRLSRAGRVEYRWQRIDIDAVVGRVVDAMRNTIVGKGAAVEVGVLADAWGDPTAIEQVFGNLIGNAFNYLDAARPGRVSVGMIGDGAPSPDGLITYYVRDNGLGIPAAYVDQVFVAFKRLHGNVATGEGIGLALVRRAVERHGGRIRVESTEGAGTTFFVSLPSREPDAPKAGAGEFSTEAIAADVAATAARAVSGNA
jgi:signal transduction histidine kinase